GETSEETALNEAWEEAGLRGDIVGEPVGTYVYSKWNGTFAVEIHLMEVTGQDATWPEDHIRERHWVKPEVARRRMLGRTFEKPVRDALLRLLGDGGD
ncbi:NUDIX domain-containing protein, partial [bacterium]|nr:NUDIX domain-containing protein [bacterium]